MKHILIPIFFLVSSWQVNAQCIVDAGPPKHFCESNILVEQKIEANITQGVPPFKIRWSQFPGSGILTDTTILQPDIFGAVNRYSVIKLVVIDSTGAVCQDFLEVTSSRFSYTAETTPVWAAEGQSIQLCAPFRTIGGFEPFGNFKWTSGLNILGSDSSVCITSTPMLVSECKPIGYGYTGKVFYYKGEDAYGCEVKGAIPVAFLPTAIDEERLSKTSPGIVFDQTTNSISFRGMVFSEQMTMTIFDIKGQQVFEQQMGADDVWPLHEDLSVNGIYILKATGSAGSQLSKKIYFMGQ